MVEAEVCLAFQPRFDDIAAAAASSRQPFSSTIFSCAKNLPRNYESICRASHFGDADKSGLLFWADSKIVTKQASTKSLS